MRSDQLLYDLDFACNDHRNGVCLGRFETCSLHPVGRAMENLELYGPQTTVRYLNLAVRVGRIKVETYGHGTWVGNWCWDGVCVNLESAAKVLCYLAKRGFLIEAAPAAGQLWDEWPQVAVAGDLEAALADLWETRP